MRNGDRTDWLALLLVVAVFAALMAAIVGIGTDAPIPLLDRFDRLSG